MQNCILCSSNDFKKIYNDTLLECNSCGLITANLTVDEKLLKEIYNENYFKGNEYSDYVSDKLVLQKNFSKRLKQINPNLKNGGKINALELGCAYGFFGELFTQHFKNSDYAGLDIAPEAIEYGKDVLRLNLINMDYLDYPSHKKYSHVFMWDVIEHLPRPDLFIKKISNEMISGGELHVTTGDISSLLPKFQKQNWRMIHPPSHLFYFSKKTLSRLLTDNGFTIKEVGYKPVYRSIKQIFYSLFLLNKESKAFYEKMYNGIPESWFIPLNTFDIMHVIAVKK
ncbi:MAG: class I SAM-dependent methyltransferase [bacterium]